MTASDARREPAAGVAFLVPYWRRLVLVLAISLVSTALSLWLPLLSRDFVDARCSAATRRAAAHRSGCSP